MKQIQLNSKVSDKAPKVKFDLWTLVMAAVRLAGRYGILAVSVLIAIAYVAVCLDAEIVATITFALMLPVLFFAALYIAVSEEVDR